MQTTSVKKETGLLVKHSLVYGMAPMVSRLIGFVMIPIYTSYLTTTDYGVMELLFMTTSLIELVAGIGITNGVTRFYFDSEVQSERNRVISSAFIGLGGMLVPIILALLAASSTFSRYILDSTAYTTYFMIAFIAMGLGLLNQINLAYLRAEKRSLLVVIATIVQLAVNLTLNIYFIVYLKMGVGGIFWANLIAMALTTGIITPMVLRKVGLRFSLNIVKELLKFGLPLIPSNIASYIVVASDRYFLKEFASISQTGIYSLGYKFGTLVNNFVTSPFNQIYAPRRLELYKREDSGRVFGQVFTYFVVAIVFVGLEISVVAKDLVQLMAVDESYWGAHKIVPLVTLAHIALSFFYHFNIGITISKKTKYFAYINISNAVLNLALNFALIPTYGMWGAAWATFICYMFRAALGYYFSNRFYKIYVEWRRVGIIFATAFVFYFLFGGLDVGDKIINIVVKSAICCAFPLVLYIARFFNPDEKAVIRSVVSKTLARVKRP